MTQQVNKIHELASEQKDSPTHSGAPECMTQQVNKIHESASEQKDSPTLWSTRMHDSTSEQNT
jgi:ferritin